MYEITPLLGISKFLGGTRSPVMPEDMIFRQKRKAIITGRKTALMQAKRRLRQQRKPRTVHVCGKKLWNWQKNNKHVIYVGGLNHDQDLEGQDRADLTLPYGQDRLITELLEVRPDMTIVMLAGSRFP